MATYNTQDIYLGLDGDIAISPNGDIKLANSFETKKQLANFILRTNKGDYVPDKRIGADLGTFIGETLTQKLVESVKTLAIANISQFCYEQEDFAIKVMPITYEELGLFLIAGGTYLDKDGKIMAISPEVITYSFPFMEGSPTPIAS